VDFQEGEVKGSTGKNVIGHKVYTARDKNTAEFFRRMNDRDIPTNLCGVPNYLLRCNIGSMDRLVVVHSCNLSGKEHRRGGITAEMNFGWISEPISCGVTCRRSWEA